MSFGGPGNDYLGSDCDTDYWCGEDEILGGPGDDTIVGNLMSEKHFGGRGDDSLVDDKSSKRPDTFHCGPGIDEDYYNKGLDQVAQDCEKLISSILVWKGGGARGGDRRYSLLEKGKGEEQMRRVTLMLAAVAVTVSLYAAVAYAATIEGA